MGVTEYAISDDDVETFRNRVVGRRVSESTFERYLRWINRFELWRPSTDAPELGDLIDFDTYLADETLFDYPWENIRGRDAPDEYSYQSRNVAMCALKLWCRLQYDVMIAEEPQNIVSGEPAPFDPHYLSHDDVARVRDEAGEACDCDGCEAMLHLSYDAIMRASEAVAVEAGDVDLSNGTIYVRATKGSKNAELALMDETIQKLRAFDRETGALESGRVFHNTYGNAWSPNAWAKHFSTIHHEVGTHAFGRHSPILHMLESPERFPYINDNDAFGSVFRRCRHHSGTMTSRYARLVGSEVLDWAEE